MSDTTAEGTTGVVVDEAAQAAALAAVEAAGAENKTGADDTKTGEPPAGGDADEVVVTIGDEAPTPEDEEVAKAPEWVRELRKSNRELSRRNKELENQAAAKTVTTEVALGVKPKLADFDYDADKFEEALIKWNNQKHAADQRATDAQAAERRAQEAWATQLGKSPTKLKELAIITDPVKFAFAVAKLERDLKVTTRKAPPPPEKVVTGSAPKSGVVDSQLERLRTDAEKTGDYSKVTQYQREKRKAS